MVIGRVRVWVRVSHVISVGVICKDSPNVETDCIDGINNLMCMLSVNWRRC